MILHNKVIVIGLLILLLITACAIFAAYITPISPNQMNYQARMQLPSWNHPFGTDFFGRDILARTIYGSRIALLVGILSVALAIVPGLALGLMAGYQRGWVDGVIMHIMDGLLSFPGLLLAIAMITVLGPGHLQATISIAIVTNLQRMFRSPLEMSAVAIELKEYAKTFPRSLYVVDKRKM